jgi:hypothetical protein
MRNKSCANGDPYWFYNGIGEPLRPIPPPKAGNANGVKAIVTCGDLMQDARVIARNSSDVFAAARAAQGLLQSAAANPHSL